MRSVALCVLVFLLFGCGTQPTTLQPEAVAQPSAEAVSYCSRKDLVQGQFFRPTGQGPFPAVVVVHDEFGPSSWINKQAQRLQHHGIAALAVDLYRGETATDVMDAHILGRGVPDERAVADIRAAVDYLTRRPDVRADAVGIVGWDLGAGYSLDAACADPRLRAAVICYGRLTTDANLLKPLQATVLAIFAGEDQGITVETINQFRAAMTKAEKRLAGSYCYPGVRHGFMSDISQASMAATDDAWAKIDAFLTVEMVQQHAK